MGTLFHQEPREKFIISTKDIEDFIEKAIELSKKYKIEFRDVLEAYRIKEIERKNRLMIDSGDIFDEQMSGFGEILEGLNSRLDQLINSLES